MASYASPFAPLNGPRSLVSAPTPLTMRSTGWTPSCPPTCSKASLESTAAVVRRRTRSSRHRGACRVSTTCGAAEPDNDSFLDGYLRVLRKHKPELVARSGRVHLVGTGPGDPELLTLRAHRLMQGADVVLYDRLVSPEILDLVGPSTLTVYVGKQRGFHTRTQEEIHDLLAAFAREGAEVVRLKGGDPFIFGRGGEEVAYLAARGIEVHVVPGITAAAGIAADLGIPLTHRGLATGVKYLTGHAREGGSIEGGLTEAAADPDATLVVYMGLGTLRELAAALAARGLSQHTPAAAVERGTTPGQRAVFGTLRTLPEAVASAGLASPTLLVIGRVVSLAPGWQAACRADGGTAMVAGLGSGARGSFQQANGSGAERGSAAGLGEGKSWCDEVLKEAESRAQARR
ncbi:UPM1 [Auxenochlorella protothecoides x Auxenochlorella symbiontica]